MGFLFLPLILLVMASDEASGQVTFCVCNRNSTQEKLQNDIDYACGHGAFCDHIKNKGECFQPNTVEDHCNYAVNSYYQNHNRSKDACNFAGTAYTTTNDPSVNGCQFPSGPSIVPPSTSPQSPNVPSTPSSTKVPPPPSTMIPPPYLYTPTPGGAPDFNGCKSHGKARIGLTDLALWLSGLYLLGH